LADAITGEGTLCKKDRFVLGVITGADRAHGFQRGNNKDGRKKAPITNPKSKNETLSSCSSKCKTTPHTQDRDAGKWFLSDVVASQTLQRNRAAGGGGEGRLMASVSECRTDRVRKLLNAEGRSWATLNPLINDQEGPGQPVGKEGPGKGPW